MGSPGGRGRFVGSTPRPAKPVDRRRRRGAAGTVQPQRSEPCRQGAPGHWAIASCLTSAEVPPGRSPKNRGLGPALTGCNRLVSALLWCEAYGACTITVRHGSCFDHKHIIYQGLKHRTKVAQIMHSRDIRPIFSALFLIFVISRRTPDDACRGTRPTQRQ